MASNKKSKKFKKVQPQTTIPAKTEQLVSEPDNHRKGKPSKGSAALLPGSWQTNTGIFFLLVIATVAIYSGDLHIGFFSVDDEGYVTKDPWIQGVNFQNISHILTTPYFSNFSPVHLFSYMFDYAIAGPNAFAFHLSSNIWAGIVAGFVYLVALALTSRQIVAVLAAILFVVHPAHIEAVAWISSRKDLVAAAFALPSLLAYLKYRKGGPASTKWYITSVFLFLLAVAGKVSVATFPAIFLAIDLFVEKRPFKRSIIDKIPFAIITIIIALFVYGAQPESGNRFDPYVFSIALGQSLWLLTGFGTYVIYRMRPEAGGMGFEIAAVLVLLIIFAAPLLLRKRFPKFVTLFYWAILGLIPAQLLSFMHPVTDRYLFFPSIAVAILIAWGIISLIERFWHAYLVPSIIAVLIIAFFWTRATLNYLSEWQDPRSVWYASMKKSPDPDIPYSLGGHYLDIAGKLGANPRGGPLSKKEEKQFAVAMWAENPKLPALLSEWEANQRGGKVEKEFQNYLWTLASENFDLAYQTRGTHNFSQLFYRRGILLLDRGDLQGAKKEFQMALEEVTFSTVKELREEVSVNSHNALGAIAWKEGNYQEALKWFKVTEEEQNRFGGTWVSDISSKRQKMENAVAIMSGKTDKNDDPEITYSLGLRYLEAAEQLGNTPRQKFSKEKMEQLAGEVWPVDKQQPALLSEWEKGQHGGPAETAFQIFLRKLAWDAFERSLKAKGSLIMPNLYFRRGMTLGESGDLKGARKEFLAAIDEAAKDNDLNLQHEIMVDSHDALGVIAWTSRDYKDALHWFKMAEEEQTRFGGNWVPDITSKRKQMEAMISSKPGK